MVNVIEQQQCSGLALCDYTRVSFRNGVYKCRCPVCGDVRLSRFPCEKLANHCGKSPTVPEEIARLVAPEKPPEPPADLPPIFQQAKHFAHDIAAFVSDGFKMVSREEYIARLAICAECEHRKGNRCDVCGCWISFRARGRAWTCELGKWPKVPENPNPSS